MLSIKKKNKKKIISRIFIGESDFLHKFVLPIQTRKIMQGQPANYKKILLIKKLIKERRPKGTKNFFLFLRIVFEII